MDHHVPRAISLGLRQRGIDVLTAEEDGQRELDDPELLTRATSLGRVMFTMDVDFLIEAARRQRSGEPFAGVVYARQLGITIGKAIEDLEFLFAASNASDLANTVYRLPL
jgi:predicted nuclease of predicted toxin-antitoxin system